MAYELVEEVLDHAPAALTAAEVLVLTVIAEQARKVTRMADIPQDMFLRRARITESGLRKIFRRLKDHGLDVRLPLHTLPGGRVMYAVPGRVCSFFLPTLPAPENCPCHRCQKAVPQDLLQTEEVPQSRTSGPQGRGTGLEGRGTGLEDRPSVTGETYGLSPVRSENRDSHAGTNGNGHPYDRQALISQLEKAKRNKRASSRPDAYQSLLNLGANNDQPP